VYKLLYEFIEFTETAKVHSNDGGVGLSRHRLRLYNAYYLA